MNYGKEIKEFARVRCEQTPNNTQIARDIKNKFAIQNDVELIRRTVSHWRQKWNIEAKKLPIRRLFIDIETGYYILKIRTFSLKNYTRFFDSETIEHEKEIICISYKWQYENEVHTLDFRNGERKMLKAFIRVLGEADEVVGHNIDKFDIRMLRTRCIYYGVLMFPNYRTLDTLTKSKHYFSFASNKLDYIAKYLQVGRKLDHDGFDMWIRAIENRDDKALEQMIEYCENDVIILEDSFCVLSPFIDHNNNFAVLTGGDKWDCPNCASHNVEMFRTYATPMGVIRREMKCNDCKKQYRISNKNYLGMLEHITKTNRQ